MKFNKSIEGNIMSRSKISLVTLFLFSCATAAFAQAPAYPSQPIELVVPFPAGGATDVIGRMVAQIASVSLGQQIVVQNRTGATGAIGSEYVARATPNGYTLLVATASTHAVLPAYRKDLPFDTISSFEPVALLATFPNLLVVNPDKVPAKNVAELIALLKARPGQFNFASSGSGSSIHFAGELFKLMTKTEMQHVPYRGSAPALADLLAGNVDLTFDNMTTVWPLAKQGRLRALGVASLERTPLAPEVPAIAETIPGFEATSWVGVVGPAGMPQAIVDILAVAFTRAIQDPNVTQRLTELGSTAGTLRGNAFREFILRDRTKWQQLAKDANISSQ
jgi:tripartite-type tricarboxylate transporter receptor subunit TctC